MSGTTATGPRLLCWWSAGIASSVASAVALTGPGDYTERIVAYCDTSSSALCGRFSDNRFVLCAPVEAHLP